MTFTTSSKKWVIFKGALKRLKWFGILYAVGLILEVPLLLLMQLTRLRDIQGITWAADKSFQPQMLFHPGAHLTNIAAAVIFGLIIFYYLHNDRASTFFHSLPIKRSALYCQNLLAGLTLMWLPLLLNGLLIYFVFSFFGITQGQWNNPQVYSSMGELLNNSPITVSILQIVGFWLFLGFLMTGLFFVFTVFVGMLTGNILLQGTLTIIGLFLPLGFYLLLKENLFKLLYGFPREINSNVTRWSSPLVNYLDNANTYGFNSDQLKGYLVYLAAAVILAGISIYLYKLRPAEAAGESLAAGWIRWIFKYGVAFCAALLGGIYLSSFNENSTGVLYLGYFLGAFLGYSISDMIAYKSFHFYKRWKGMAVFGFVFLMLIGAVRFDLFGYERFVPTQESVKAVLVSNFARDGVIQQNGDSNIKGMTTPENIERVRQLHRQIVDNEEINKNMERSTRRLQNMSRQTEFAQNPELLKRRVSPLTLVYILQNGSRVTRTYTIDVNSYRQYLYPIFDTPEAKKTMFARYFQIDTAKLDQIGVNNFHLGKNVRIYQRDEMDEAMAAIREDLLSISYEEAVEGKIPSQASVEFFSKPGINGGYFSYNIATYRSFSNFEAFLKKHGYWDTLFLKPDEVSRITVKKADTGVTSEITDKQEIQSLLNLCNLTNEQEFLMEKLDPRIRKTGEYLGKIVLKNGEPIFVAFNGTPYASLEVEQIIAH